MTARARTTGSRLRVGLGAIALLGLLVTAIGCSSDDPSDDAGSKKKAATTTSTVPAPPSTVSDADFDSEAATAEALVDSAGTDTCALLATFSEASSLPAPANATQTQRGVAVVAKLFVAAADAAPPNASADAAVLRKAAQDLQAEGAANNWDPEWLTGQPGPAAISDPAVATAFRNYQTEGATLCGGTAGAGTTTP